MDRSSRETGNLSVDTAVKTELEACNSVLTQLASVSYARDLPRMTKPKKPLRKVDPSKRDRLLSVRYSAAEFDQLCRLAKRARSLSDFVRERSLNRQPELPGVS